MNTMGWLFILAALVLIRMAWKGQIVDDKGNIVVFDNLSKLWVGIVTNNKDLIKEATSAAPSGLSKPSVSTQDDAAGGSDLSFGAADTATPASWDTLNPRTVDEAVEWALNRTTYMTGMCERMVTVAYGHSGGYPTAKAHADAMQLNSGTPPRGALVFHATKNPAQHVCLSIGNGYIVSTDFDGTKYKVGAMSKGPLSAINKWGPMRGWSAPLFPGSRK